MEEIKGEILISNLFNGISIENRFIHYFIEIDDVHSQAYTIFHGVPIELVEVAKYFEVISLLPFNVDDFVPFTFRNVLSRNGPKIHFFNESNAETLLTSNLQYLFNVFFIKSYLTFNILLENLSHKSSSVIITTDGELYEQIKKTHHFAIIDTQLGIVDLAQSLFVFIVRMIAEKDDQKKFDANYYIKYQRYCKNKDWIEAVPISNSMILSANEILLNIVRGVIPLKKRLVQEPADHDTIFSKNVNITKSISNEIIADICLSSEEIFDFGFSESVAELIKDFDNLDNNGKFLSHQNLTKILAESDFDQFAPDSSMLFPKYALMVPGISPIGIDKKISELNKYLSENMNFLCYVTVPIHY